MKAKRIIMIKSKAKYIITALCLPLLLCSCSLFNISNLPHGELISSHKSPTGEYMINIYLVDGGATVDYAVRGEAVRIADNERRNIYWDYHRDDAEVTWISDTLVSINGICLDVRHDTYDYRYDRENSKSPEKYLRAFVICSV